VKNVARARLPSGDFTVPASVGSWWRDRARLPSGDFIVPASVGSGAKGEVDSNTKHEQMMVSRARAPLLAERKKQVKAAAEVPRFPPWGQHALDGRGPWATVKPHGPLKEIDLATYRQQGKAVPTQRCGDVVPGPKLSVRFKALADDVASSDSDKGDYKANSEGDYGNYEEDDGIENYFIGDEEVGCSEQYEKQEDVLATVAGLRLQVAEAISSGGNVRAILDKVVAAFGTETVPEWVGILAGQF